MDYQKTSETTARMKATKPGEDLRNFDADGRFICNADHPWDHDTESAPKGVRHEETEAIDDFRVQCTSCGVKFRRTR